MLRTPERREVIEALKSSVQDVFSSVMITFKESVSHAGSNNGGSKFPDQLGLHTCTQIKIEGEIDATVILRCDAQGATDIAQGLLMLEPGETIALSDIEDALGECANMIVGKMKTDLLDPLGEFRLGLPQNVPVEAVEPWQPAGHQVYHLTEGVLSIELWCDDLAGSTPGEAAAATAQEPAKPKGVEPQVVVKAVQDSIAEVLSMVTERTLAFEGQQVERTTHPAAGENGIHLSFKLGFPSGGRSTQGCVLIALPDAIALACYLMMVPEDAVAGRRNDKELDRPTMDAMLEIGNFIGSAVDSAVRTMFVTGPKVRSEGCQGVRPGRPPVLRRGSEDPLWVVRPKLQVHNYPPLPAVIMLPAAVFEGLQSAA